ncbi:hypothetical protein ACTWKB_02790 [Bacillus sp. 4A_MP2]
MGHVFHLNQEKEIEKRYFNISMAMSFLLVRK